MAKLRCALLDDYQSSALGAAEWQALGNVQVEAFSQYFKSEDDVVAAIKAHDIVVIMRERTPFPASLFARLPKLKLLITTGMKNAYVDLAAAAAHGVTVCGTASHPTPPVELTWALLLGLARNLVQENVALRSNGVWQSSVGADLYGRKLGLLGLGKIGSRVAKVGLAFGMGVLAWSQHLTAERAEEVGAQLVKSKEQLLKESNFVSIHLRLSERTKGLIGAQDLKQMKPSAYLINTSRAAIVNQAALISALERKEIAGAGLDVFETEPLPDTHPFRTLPNVLATPHLGYVTQLNYQTYYQEAVEDIKAYLNGSPVRLLE